MKTLVRTERETVGPHPADSLTIGSHAGPWRIEHELGRGGMGIVYAVVHAQIGKRAALKVLHRRIPDPATHAQRMLLEARVVNAIDHTNVVDIFDVGWTTDGRPYIVMERLHGRPLAMCDLATNALLAVLLEVSAALIAAHDAGVVHRDLKPDNIFIGNNGRVTVLDWGIARMLHADVHATIEGQLVGTPTYLAPEQARGQQVTPKTDVYSLGALAFEVLVGEPPFDAKSASEVMAMHLYEAPPRPRDLWPGVPVRLEGLLLAMLSKDPAARPTMREVASELRKILDERLAPLDASESVELPQRRRWPLVAGGFALAGGALLFAAAPHRGSPANLVERPAAASAPIAPAEPHRSASPVVIDCATPSAKAPSIRGPYAPRTPRLRGRLGARRGARP